MCYFPHCVCDSGLCRSAVGARARPSPLPVRFNDAWLCFFCVPAGNTLCKSGSIAVFGNVVYSGLLNDHLWHLGVPLFTRLVRASGGPSVHTYLHFVGGKREFLVVSAPKKTPKQASGAEFPKVCNGLRLMPAPLDMCWVKLYSASGMWQSSAAGCETRGETPLYLGILLNIRHFKRFAVLSAGGSFR